MFQPARVEIARLSMKAAMASLDAGTDFTGIASGARKLNRTSRFRDAMIPVAIALGGMIAGALYSRAQGLDANWDWQNYHEYNVWAAITDRYGTDVVPAGFQTYFNPVVYFPVYYLRHFVEAPYGAMIMGANHGFSVVLIYFLTRILLRETATAGANTAAILIAMTGPMTLVETGTSFADILTALPVIAAFALILSADDTQWSRYTLAGLLIGAAVGLKLTNVVFALGAAACLLLSARAFIAIPCLTIGGAIGAVATGGAWSMMLWRELGNPLFPLFNGVLTSKEMHPTNILDVQFTPRSLFDALAYPFYWIQSNIQTAEHPFRDARFAVVTVLLAITLVARLAWQVPMLPRRSAQFLVLFLVSYAAWLGLFAIQRYAVVLEMLCGPLIVMLLSQLAALAPERDGLTWAPTRAGALMLPVAAGIALWCQPGDWWHRPWSNPYQPVIAEPLQQPATYFLLDKPVSYIAPWLPSPSRFYQIADIALPVLPNGEFDRRIRRGLEYPLAGGVWELHTRGKVYRSELLDTYGLQSDDSKPCVEIEGIVPSTALVACPLITRSQ